MHEPRGDVKRKELTPHPGSGMVPPPDYWRETMHPIVKALSVRSDRNNSVAIEGLRETVRAREGTAFLSGLHIGYITGFQDGMKEVAPVVKPPRFRPLAFALFLSMIFASTCIGLALGWHDADAKWQGKEITTIQTLIDKGWAPTPKAIREGATDEIYDRIHAVPK